MNIEEFLDWFRLTNVNTEYVQVQYSKQDGFGLYSRQDIREKDFLILSIPEYLFIKPSFQNENLTGFEHLIIYLLSNLSNPYVKFLQSIQTIPSWCQLKNENYPRQILNQLKKHQQKYQQSRNKLLQYTDQQFQWAYYTINTRCVHFDMQLQSKDQDTNLCLIPFLDFVNHSIHPNTISKYNPLTNSYEIRTLKSIDLNEQITFLYNPHSNVDLFIEYGFVLLTNPSNLLNIEYELEQLLSKQQIQMLKSFHYWNSLEFYQGDNDLSWTILKSIELFLNQSNWSPYDEPSQDIQQQIFKQLKILINLIKQNLDKDFQHWTTEQFAFEKNILEKDFLTILNDTSRVIKKSYSNSD